MYKKIFICFFIFQILLSATISADPIKPLSETNEMLQDSSDSLTKLVIGFPHGLIEYNPLYTYSSTEAQLYTALYEGLVSYDPFTLQPIPAVAEKWDISSNKKEFLFYLRNDSYYWDGVNVTAKDFCKSWLKMLMPGNNSEYAFLLDIVEGAEQFRKGEITDPQDVGIKAIDEYVLKVVLNSPAEHFLKILCHHSFVPVHPSFIDKKVWTDLPSAPGNGPYYILKKNENSLILTKNLLYWNEQNVKISNIEIVFIDDNPEINSKLFNEGKIQWLTGSFSSELIKEKKHIIFNASFAANYFFFNSKNEPWDNETLRQALVLAAPLEKIRDNNFLFFPASTLVPPIPDYPQITGFEKQDKEKAVSLLKENNLSLPKELVIKIPESFESARVATMLKESWEEIFGIAVKINIMSYQNYYQDLKKDDYALGTMSWIGDFPDPLTFLQMWTSSSNLNDAGYKNSAFDSDITKSLSLIGRERYELLSKAEKKLIDSAIILPVSFTPSINLVNTDIISGWYPNPIDIHPMKYFKFRKKIIPYGLVFANLEHN
ncbi:MAG: peptide ABC transporter substrate-binding protein [Spirochaetaceae bacterium]|nr:peptide ABC transporter substrate-binding protein [Spirochaetaceae bacterium]